MPRPARVSPDRILAAAAAEFAARGFAGARVDRIARRARVNKAMLYYHFQSKAGLYRALLQRVFARAAERLEAIAAAPDPPAQKLDRAILGFAAFIAEHAFFPAIMLREVAEGGARLDAATLAAMARLPRAVGRIVRQGTAGGAFRPVDPVFAYFSILGPIVLYLAGAPIRHEIARRHLVDPAPIAADDFVRQLRTAAARALAAETGAPMRATP